MLLVSEHAFATWMVRSSGGTAIGQVHPAVTGSGRLDMSLRPASRVRACRSGRMLYASRMLMFWIKRFLFEDRFCGTFRQRWRHLARCIHTQKYGS